MTYLHPCHSVAGWDHQSDSHTDALSSSLHSHCEAGSAPSPGLALRQNEESPLSLACWGTNGDMLSTREKNKKCCHLMTLMSLEHGQSRQSTFFPQNNVWGKLRKAYINVNETLLMNTVWMKWSSAGEWPVAVAEQGFQSVGHGWNVVCRHRWSWMRGEKRKLHSPY